MAARTTPSPDPVLHRAAGFTISSDRKLPGFAGATHEAFPDIHVHTAAPERWSSAGEILQRGPNVLVRRGPDGYTCEYSDDTRFWVDTNGRNIWCTWETTLEDACTYLAGSILGLAIRARGDLALHASAVVLGGRALVIAGPHGSGKSTTAAAFGTRGYDVLADDVVRLARSEARWIAHPYTSMLRLWPDSAQHILGTDDRLPRIVPSWEKRALYPGAHGVSWASDPVPLGWVVALSGPGAADSSACVAPVSARHALLVLSANSSASHAIGADLRTREFEQLASVVRDVPCAGIEKGPESRSLDATVDAILGWLAGVPSPTRR